MRLCLLLLLLLGLMLLYPTTPAGDGARRGRRTSTAFVRSVAVHVVELTLRSRGTGSTSTCRPRRTSSCSTTGAATTTSSSPSPKTNPSQSGRVQRNCQSRVNRQQVISPRNQVVHVILKPDVFTSQLVQAGQ